MPAAELADATPQNVASPQQPGVPDTAPACPSTRPINIHHIVETVDRYNPQNIEVLEKYVDDNMANDAYDRDACLAVLKLYQFNPTFNNSVVVCNILALALGALPDADFSLCLYMLSEEVLADSEVAKLVALHTLLQQAKFAAFWESLATDARDLVAPYIRFDDRIREYVSGTLAIAYQVISKQALAQSLGFKTDAAGLDAFLAKKGWKVDPTDAKLAVLPPTKENQARPVVVQEEIKFEHLTRIIGSGRNQ
ncbi:Eukaryotic translation initiation factor 3 subunit K [Thoreauomyces humboldtii]|nr:Eukaryotic translation initiation factor 3 subunit K [Thoreauomyces humboldtii]